MNESSLDLKKICSGIHTVGIAGHVRPDGDAVGACLALQQYLQTVNPQIRADVFLEAPPSKFSLLKGFDGILDASSCSQVYDLFFALDIADRSRLGTAERLFSNSRETVCIDHHISNTGFAGHNLIVPTASSTCEVLTGLMDDAFITTDTAVCLYLGIVHDTGVFRHSCTLPETMETAARLMRKGFNANRIINETYYDKTFNENRVMGAALSRSERFLEDSLIFSYITMQDMRLYQVTPAGLDGIVQNMMSTVGVETAVFLYEAEPESWKVSFRSRERVDVSRICRSFGGGGHIRAAGCNLSGTIESVRNTVLKAVEDQLRQVSC